MRCSHLSRASAKAAPLSEERPAATELLNSIVLTIGYKDVTLGINSDAISIVELSLATAPGREIRPIASEFLDTVILLIDNVDIPRWINSYSVRLVELADAGPRTAPF